jgi:hypothetical protein
LYGDMRRNMTPLGRGSALAAFSAIPVFLLLWMFGNMRRKLRRHGIGRCESEYTAS